MYPTDQILLWEGIEKSYGTMCELSSMPSMRVQGWCIAWRCIRGRSELKILRHPHGKRGAAGGQARAESTAWGLLKRKHAHRKVLSQGELRLCHREWANNPAETTGMRYKNVNLKNRMQNWRGPVGCFGQKENIKRQSLRCWICKE